MTTSARAASTPAIAEHPVRDWIDGKAILDLGVGAGRTTAFLLSRAASYVGLDYSSRAVAACRARFPGADIQYGDARDLSRFADERFDFVLFACNGIDAVAHDDRGGCCSILSEWRLPRSDCRAGYRVNSRFLSAPFSSFDFFHLLQYGDIEIASPSAQAGVSKADRVSSNCSPETPGYRGA